MQYLVQYTNRKGELKVKRLEAKDKTAICDYIRREGARDISILPAVNAHRCPACGKIVEGSNKEDRCSSCSENPF